MKNVEISMESTVSVKQAYLIMFEFLNKEWELSGSSKTDQLGGILSNLSLWETEGGGSEPMDSAVFPQWLECASNVLKSKEGYDGADIKLDGKTPTTKVRR